MSIPNFTSKTIETILPKHAARDTINQVQFDELKELLEDDFYDLVQTYKSDSLDRVQEIKDAVTTGDHAKGFDAAHTLKGASANLGASRLTHLCYLMQEACRDNTTAKQTDLAEQIADELRQVHQEVDLRLNGLS